MEASFIREAVALVVLALNFLFLSCKRRAQDFSGSYICSTSRSRGEAQDVRGRGRETNTGLNPFYTEISLKIGGKRTLEYLDVRSITLSEWLVRIW